MCADNSTRELHEKSKEVEHNPAREVDKSKQDEKGSTETSLDSKDELGLSNEPSYLSFTDAYS